ncbi:MAG: hypothetical protein ABI893_00285 [Polaromonas sp.]|uniref:hypothetical protein n=1 Tax=Polaromonas sp. TaxID=1869339 RepID=UPI003264E605
METTILISIVTALSALLGVALTAYLQLRSQRVTQHFQLTRDAAKHEREQVDQARGDAIRRLAEAHMLLSKIAREFSVTNLVILRGSKMTDSEYDLRYLLACGELDELRAFAGLHEPPLMEEIEKLNGQMNVFWGNFKNVLYLTHKGERVDHTTSCLTSAHAAANKIGAKVASIKDRLAHLALMMRDDK